MKITKQKLKEIIKEELKLIQELDIESNDNLLVKARELAGDLDSILKQFDQTVITKPSNIELIYGKAEVLLKTIEQIAMSAREEDAVDDDRWAAIEKGVAPE